MLKEIIVSAISTGLVLASTVKAETILKGGERKSFQLEQYSKAKVNQRYYVAVPVTRMADSKYAGYRVELKIDGKTVSQDNNTLLLKAGETKISKITYITNEQDNNKAISVDVIALGTDQDNIKTGEILSLASPFKKGVPWIPPEAKKKLAIKGFSFENSNLRNPTMWDINPDNWHKEDKKMLAAIYFPKAKENLPKAPHGNFWGALANRDNATIYQEIADTVFPNNKYILKYSLINRNKSKRFVSVVEIYCDDKLILQHKETDIEPMKVKAIKLPFTIKTDKLKSVILKIRLIAPNEIKYPNFVFIDNISIEKDK